MDRDVLTDTVCAAQRGDTDAFAVGEFHTVAAATAFGWLRDAEVVRDVCQEALTEAWRLLGQLDEPRAFPGWFRRIVVKHCDRHTRVRTRIAGGLDDVDAPATTPDPSTVAAQSDEFSRLRLAVEALPRDERIVVALRYLAERSEPDVAAWLDLPLGTVKTRLHRARNRLRTEMHTMATKRCAGCAPNCSTTTSPRLCGSTSPCARATRSRSPRSPGGTPTWSTRRSRGIAT